MADEHPNGPVRVAGYEGLTEIGRGGFAVVYRARQVAFDRVVALKVLARPDLDDQTRRRFERECKAAGALSWHPHVVPVYDAGVTDLGLPYLAMEFVEAGSLADRLEAQGPLAPQAVATIGVELAGALASAHAEGLLHRDVKPDNVLIGRFDEPKLADFGIAAIEGGTVTASGLLTATIAHAAPEVLEGKRATAQSDVYSLGSTLFELLAGHPAFVGEDDESIVAMIARVATQPAPDLRDRGVPDALAEVIGRTMAKDPDDRPTGAADLGAALQEGERRLGWPVTQLRLPAGVEARQPALAEAEETEQATPTVPAVPSTVATERAPAPVPVVEAAAQPRRSRRPWLVAGVVTLVALVAGVVAVTAGGDGAGDRPGAPAEAPVDAETPSWVFRGDLAHTGVHPGPGPTPPVTERWRFSTGAVVSSSPAVADGVVYFGGDDRTIYALDADDGSERWRHGTTDAVVSGPAVAGGVVYLTVGADRLVALDAGDATELWRFEGPTFTNSSPAVVHGVVHVAAEGGVYARDATDGTEVWTFERAGSPQSSPAVVPGVVYVGYVESVIALDVGDGSETWRFETDGEVFSSPAVAGGVVYIGSRDGNVYALDAADGTEIWRFATGDEVRSSPAVDGGVVYVGSVDGRVYAVDAEEGTEQWRFQTGREVFSSPAVVGGVVYVGSGDGNVYALDTDNGTEIWRFETGGAVASSPTVVGGVVYVGSDDGNLYAIGGS